MKRIPPMVTLRALREAHGMTLEQLADRLAEHGVTVDKGSLSNIELGRKKASLRLIRAWARVLRLNHGVDVFQTEDLRNLLADDDTERRSA